MVPRSVLIKAPRVIVMSWRDKSRTVHPTVPSKQRNLGNATESVVGRHILELSDHNNP